MQKIVNTGMQPLKVPYTLAINSPTYVLVLNSWNWGISGSADKGTFSGPVTMVRVNPVCSTLQEGCDPDDHHARRMRWGPQWCHCGSAGAPLSLPTPLESCNAPHGMYVAPGDDLM